MIDYSNEGFILPIRRDEETGYASVNSMMYRDEDGLDVTGNYFIYLLHPVMGSTHFTLEPDNSYSGWQRIGGAIWMTDDIVQEIINAIENKRTAKNA